MQELRGQVNYVVDEIESISNGTNDRYESLYDYLADVLDMEYICNSRKEYLGARICVAWGGPGIWIDTRRGVVEGYWGGESYEASLDASSQRELDSICEEYFDSF